MKRNAERSVPPLGHGPELSSLTALGITRSFGRTKVLSSVDFTLEPGVTALLGPNGSGKTTLLDILATVAVPDEGVVQVQGLPCDTERQARSLRRRIGYLPQPFCFVPSFTARQVVQYTAWLRGHRISSLDADQALGSLGLADRAETAMRKLSGGMVQRVAIAAATVGVPPIILLDEPSVGLDPAQRASFRKYLGTLTDAAILMSTHLVEDAVNCADRIVVLTGGSLVFDAPPEALLDLGGRPGTDGRAERGYLTLVPEGDS